MDFNSSTSRSYKIKPEDVVVDINPPFGVEVILTKNEIQLSELSEGINSQFYLKKDVTPILIVETFGLKGRRPVLERYRIIHPELT